MKANKNRSSSKVKVEFDLETDQTRTVGMPMAKNDFDRIDKENPFTKMESNPACKAAAKDRC